MTEKMTQLMKDIPAVRWTALVLLASAMFFGYIFMDILSPIKDLRPRKAPADFHIIILDSLPYRQAAGDKMNFRHFEYRV